MFFGLKIGGKYTLLKYTRSINNSVWWLRRSCPMVFLRFVFGLRKTLNDCSAEQETVGAKLKMTTTFLKLQRALSPRKIGWDNIALGYIYTEIAKAISFYIFHNRCKDYLKPSANFGNIMCECFSQILANKASFKFR